MSKNYIFGSGLIGLIAKTLLPDWELVPFKRSRFFSYEVPLCDNFVSVDDEIDHVIARVGYDPKRTNLYSRAYSVAGQIISQHSADHCAAWLHKVYGDNSPGHAYVYWSKRLTTQIYDGVKSNSLYAKLVSENWKDLVNNHKLGQVTTIGDHFFVRDGKTHEFDHVINTVPLNVIYELAGIKKRCQMRTAHMAHVVSKGLNFEGHNQLLVADSALSFYKVINIAPDRYVFYGTQEMGLNTYLTSIPGSQILDGTSVADSIPCGDIPNITDVTDLGIKCVGCFAQHDACSDTGSSILRLVRTIAGGFKPR